ncbi:MAG TPA: alpha-(1-_3)-arabinofuranosyltransferase family protein, partial [Candidatus Eisenbacteria bacterium]|nr:alpha-(1->3)-arabinofuranosyltransferase family protein [Candidatus Eisenbacteria bacterium]
GSPRPVLVHQALAESPGIRRVAQFGPFVGGGGGQSDILVDEGLDRPYPAVEVFEVQPGVGQVQAYPLDEVPVVSGGPESILELADRQWLQGRPTVLAGDAPSWLATTESVVTDGMRRREVTFGRLEGDASDVLAPGDPRRLSGTSRDYLPWPGSDRHETVAEVVGASSLSASSSASDANAFGGPRPEHQPFAALDGDAATSWLSAGLGGAVGQWLEVRLDRPADLRQVQVDLDPAVPGPPVTRILVTTDRGSVPARVGADGGPVVVRLPAGLTSRVRVTATAVQGGGRGFVAGISELHLPGVHVARPLVTPSDLPAAAPLPLVALDAADLRRTSCVRLGSRPLCTRGLAQPGEDELGLDRIVRLAQAGAYDVVATVVPRPGTALNARLAAGAPGILASASSSQVSDPAGSPQAAVDRDLGTGWVARSGDPAPTLVLRLPPRRRITGVQLVVDPALAASLPREVQVSAPGVRLPRVGMLDGTGILRFAALTTDKVAISFPSLSGRSTYDPFDKVVSFMPVGVSEVRLIGADDLRRAAPAGDRSSPCGQGPTLSSGGVQVPTRVTASAADLRALAAVTARPCAAGPVRLPAGDTRIVADRTALWSVVGLSLVPAGTSPTVATAGAAPVQVRSWGRTTREVALPARSQPLLLVVHENRNDGWSAVADGTTLTPLTVDGWQQGWVVPAGRATRVSLTFGPDRTYRIGLGGGALAAVLLLVAAAWPVGAGLRPA